MIDDRAPHEGPILLTTAQLADRLGITTAKIHNHKAKYRDLFVEGVHFTRDDETNSLLWTAAGEALVRQAQDGTIDQANDQALSIPDDHVPTLDQFADDMATAIARDIVWGEVRKRIPSAITREIVRLLSSPDAKAEFRGIVAEWISPLQSDALDSAVNARMIEASHNGYRALVGVSDEQN